MREIRTVCTVGGSTGTVILPNMLKAIGLSKGDKIELSLTSTTGLRGSLVEDGILLRKA